MIDSSVVLITNNFIKLRGLIMISEQDKQAILNGAYGITRNGTKVKYLFTSDINSIQNKHLFVEYILKDGKLDFHNHLWLTEDFKYYVDSRNEYRLDVIGLWKDKPEPLDLERALAGESVMLRNGSKANILKQVKDTLIGYFDECSPYAWDINGDADRAADSTHDIIGMWKDYESNTVTLTLPCPLKEPQNGMWFIVGDGVAMKSDYQKDIPTRTFNKDKFDNGFYFSSKEDTQAWLDALKNNRR